MMEGVSSTLAGLRMEIFWSQEVLRNFSNPPRNLYVPRTRVQHRQFLHKFLGVVKDTTINTVHILWGK